MDRKGSGKRLRELRFHLKELFGVNERQIADLIGVHESTIRRYESRDGVKKTAALALQAVFGVNASWLFTGKGPMFLRKPSGGQRKYVQSMLGVPFFMPVSKPIPVVRRQVDVEFSKLREEHIEDYLYIPAKDVPEDALAIRVQDESMSPLIMEGEFVIFDPKSVQVAVGDIVVVKNRWGELLVRRYRGERCFASENPGYPTLEDCTVAGKVVKTVRVRDFS